MATYLKVIQAEKGKGTKSQEAADEVAYMITFNQSITHAMAGPVRLCLH